MRRYSLLSNVDIGIYCLFKRLRFWGYGGFIREASIDKVPTFQSMALLSISSLYENGKMKYMGKPQCPSSIRLILIGRRFSVYLQHKPCTPRSRKLDQIGDSYEACGS